jgi:hypothetical protein
MRTRYEVKTIAMIRRITLTATPLAAVVIVDKVKSVSTATDRARPMPITGGNINATLRQKLGPSPR